MAWNIYLDSVSVANGETDIAARITQGTETLQKNFHINFNGASIPWLKQQLWVWVNSVQTVEGFATTIAQGYLGTFDIGTGVIMNQYQQDLGTFREALGTYRKLRKGYEYGVFGTQDTAIWNFYVNLGSALRGTFLQHTEFAFALDDLGV